MKIMKCMCSIPTRENLLRTKYSIFSGWKEELLIKKNDVLDAKKFKKYLVRCLPCAVLVIGYFQGTEEQKSYNLLKKIQKF